MKTHSSGGCTAIFGGSGFEGLAHGPCNSWYIEVDISATNACGTTTLHRPVAPPAPYPCGSASYEFVESSHNLYQLYLPPPDPCLTSASSMPLTTSEPQPEVEDEVEILVAYIDGHVVMKTQNKVVDLSILKPGIYIINALINNETVVSQRVSVK